MTTNSMWKTGLVAAVAAAGLVVGGTALAEHGGWGAHGPERMREHVSQRIDAALDAANATNAQRAAVNASRDRVFASFEASHVRPDFEQYTRLFEADKLDGAEVTRLRGEHEARMMKVGDAIVQAVSEAHDALNPQQRKLVADWVRSHHPAEHVGAPRGHGAHFMRAFATSRIDEALDAVKVTQPQRDAIHAARDHVFAVLEEHEDPSARIESALTLFEADKVDPAKVAELRTQHQAQARKVGDAIVQALYDTHDALTAPQRKALVEYLHGQMQKHAPRD